MYDFVDPSHAVSYKHHTFRRVEGWLRSPLVLLLPGVSVSSACKLGRLDRLFFSQYTSSMNALSPLSDFTPRDPASLGYPPTLPIEVALKTAPLPQIQAEYGFTDEEWAALRHDPAFLADLAAAVEMVRKDGMSFKMKAKLQAEELLKTSWRLIHAPADEVPSSVKADLIKATARWAGYDVKEGAGAGGNATALQININL